MSSESSDQPQHAQEQLSLGRGLFRGSFLMFLRFNDWLDEHTFGLWSTQAQAFYRIDCRVILEFHFVRSGVGPVPGDGNGFPLSDIVYHRGEVFDFYRQRIQQFHREGYDSGEDPICLEFHSHLLMNRRRDVLNRRDATGLLVVCRQVHVVRDERYDDLKPEGPRPGQVG
jgi:hypothetical protein